MVVVASYEDVDGDTFGFVDERFRKFKFLQGGMQAAIKRHPLDGTWNYGYYVGCYQLQRPIRQTDRKIDGVKSLLFAFCTAKGSICYCVFSNSKKV